MSQEALGGASDCDVPSLSEYIGETGESGTISLFSLAVLTRLSRSRDVLDEECTKKNASTAGYNIKRVCIYNIYYTHILW